MILLFSVLFLFLLVWWGMKIKEGMTIETASKLIKELGTYSTLTTENKKTNTDNNVNEVATYKNILELNITDTKYNYIINNENLNESSKINMIKSLLVNDITDTSGNLTLEQFQNILSVYTSQTLSNSEKITEIMNLTNKDSRFSFLINSTLQSDTEKLSAIQTAIINILNAPLKL
jgi:hypothetical protein